MKLATAVQMRELDRLATEEDGIPSIDLMEQAADGIVQTALELPPPLCLFSAQAMRGLYMTAKS